MSKFTTAVCMACTQEQYERDLRKPLLDMGYRETDIRGIDNHPFIVNNHCGELGVITNLSNLTDDMYVRYLIDHYNPELYLGLAAMTNEKYGIKGEWWVYTKVSYESFTHDMLYKGLQSINHSFSFLNNKGERDGYADIPLYYFRKATKAEIIKYLTKEEVGMKYLGGLVQPGRIVELRDGKMGIIIKTHLDLIIQLEHSWDNFDKYNPELKHNLSKSNDIMRIREIDREYQILRKYLKDAPIIWERKEPKEYTLDEIIKMAGLNKEDIIIKQG